MFNDIITQIFTIKSKPFTLVYKCTYYSMHFLKQQMEIKQNTYFITFVKIPNNFNSIQSSFQLLYIKNKQNINAQVILYSYNS